MKSLYFRAGATLLALSLSAAASAGDLGVGFKAGTLGLGFEGRYQPVPYLDLRVGANAYDFEDTGSQAGVNYTADFNLESLYATANFRFPLSPFRVTAGVFSNGNEITMTSVDTPNFNIGGQTFTSADVGELSSVTSFADTAPYVGIGYDFELFGKVGLNFDLGVLWQGEPDVTLNSTGALAQINDQAFLDALEAERQELLDDVQAYKAYPVVSLAFVYNF